MAVPTITNITPDSGLTRGLNQVEITGTNFSLAPEDPVDSSGSAFQSVKVLFGALQSPAAFAITTTRVVATVPTYIGNSMGESGDAVDVTLHNLDEYGDEIPTEFVVSADAYTYKRPLFTDMQVGEYVISQFVKYLRRHVHPNVWITMGRSYSEGDEQLLDVIKKATLPLIWINGVDYEDDNLAQGMGAEEVDVTATDFREYRVGRAVTIQMPSVMIFSRAEHSREIFALAQAVINAFRDVPHLSCDPHTFDVASTVYNYPLSIPADGMPSFDLGPENDGLKSCSMSMAIEEVNLTDLAGTLTDVGWTVEDADSPEIILTTG
jgi:hypothetical protein